jgi:hypothetical protein
MRKELELPCDIGDTIFYIFKGKVIDLEVKEIELFKMDKKMHITLKCFQKGMDKYGYSISCDNLGITFFLEKNHAEQILKLQKK